MSSNEELLITNIQRFSVHDGPGIRTTVFIKGCSLRCPWCSNPENLEHRIQEYNKDGITGIYGKYISCPDLVDECLKDKVYFQGQLCNMDSWNIENAEGINRLPGGVTFSGGEPLLQMKNLMPVCDDLHKHGVHITVESCLFIPLANLKMAIEHIDFFYVDVKILNPAKCKSILGGELDLFLSNLEYLLNWRDSTGRRKPIVIRIPVIGEYTDGDENRAAVFSLLQKYNDSILKIELIKEHGLAEKKYKSLGLQMDYHGVDEELIARYKTELDSLGVPVEVCAV